MHDTAEKVVSQVLALPADARIGMVEKILASLNLPTRSDVERAWSEEAERRVREMDEGKVRLISGERVFMRLRAKYRR